MIGLGADAAFFVSNAQIDFALAFARAPSQRAAAPRPASWLMQPSSWRTHGDETIEMGDLPSVSSSLSSPPASWHFCGRFRLAMLPALPRGLRGVNVLLGRFLGASGAASWDSFGCFHGDLSARFAAFVQAEAGVRFADVGPRG